MNAFSDGYSFLEAQDPGLHGRLVHLSIQSGGVIHASDTCYLIGERCADHPRRLAILYAGGDMEELLHFARHLARDYDELAWQRVFKGRQEWRVWPIRSILKRRHLFTTL